MIEILRSVTAALGDPTYGVNFHLASMPLDGDDRPDPVSMIVDGTSSAEVALMLEAPDRSLSVRLDSDVDLFDGEASQDKRDFTVPIFISFYLEDEDPSRHIITTYIVLRAAHKALQAWFDNSTANTRVRNGFMIYNREAVTQTIDKLENNDVVGTAGIRLTLRVRDLNP